MRVLKFRAWDISHKEMEFIEDFYWFEESGVHDSEGRGHHANYIIMQYNGMLDDQGTEIFDGDIVKFSDNLLKIKDVVGVVEFKNGSYVINSGLITHYRWMDYVVEVIGNKFENYELIEDELNQEIHQLEKQIEDKLKVLDEYEGEM